VLIRRETSADVEAIREVHASAFAAATPGGGVPVEVGLVDALRDDAGAWIPELSLVALDGAGGVVGHVVCTRARVRDAPALGLGPLGVRADRQRSGVGAALMHAVLGAADARGEPVVVLLGHADYYPRFGFRPAADLGITPPVAEWAPHFQARPLAAYAPEIRGPFTYAAPFTEL
jgi:putative acetyltransferase